jgi:kelch-like protein 10
VAVLGDQVYAIGGESKLYVGLETAERYDYKTNQWSLIASMNVQRSCSSATALNGNMNPVNQ